MPLAISSVGRSVGFQVPGAMTSKVCGLSPAGHLRTVQRRSTDLTDSSVVTDEKPTDGWKLLEQGPKSQATSKTCSVGPSSVIDASDLTELNLVSGHASGNQP